MPEPKYYYEASVNVFYREIREDAPAIERETTFLVRWFHKPSGCNGIHRYVVLGGKENALKLVNRWNEMSYLWNYILIN